MKPNDIFNNIFYLNVLIVMIIIHRTHDRYEDWREREGGYV